MSARRDLLVLIGALLLQFGLLVWDIQTTRGQTEWVLHLLPVGLSLLQRRRVAPWLLCGLAWVYLAMGFVLSATTHPRGWATWCAPCCATGWMANWRCCTGATVPSWCLAADIRSTPQH